MNYSERMDMRNRHNQIRDWLNSLPGAIETLSGPEALWRIAWGACGVENVGIVEFKAALKGYGFDVEELGNKFILRLPGRPMAAANNADRLRNIVR